MVAPEAADVKATSWDESLSRVMNTNVLIIGFPFVSEQKRGPPGFQNVCFCGLWWQLGSLTLAFVEISQNWTGTCWTWINKLWLAVRTALRWCCASFYGFKLMWRFHRDVAQKTEDSLCVATGKTRTATSLAWKAVKWVRRPQGSPCKPQKIPG